MKHNYLPSARQNDEEVRVFFCILVDGTVWLQVLQLEMTEVNSVCMRINENESDGVCATKAPQPPLIAADQIHRIGVPFNRRHASLVRFESWEREKGHRVDVETIHFGALRESVCVCPSKIRLSKLTNIYKCTARRQIHFAL